VTTYEVDARTFAPRTGSYRRPVRQHTVPVDSVNVILEGLNSFVGTGGGLEYILSAAGAMRLSGSSASVVVDYLDDEKPTSEILNVIRSVFALSVTDLAGVLGVERPTIYSWLKDQSTPSKARADRLGQVLRLADVWVSLAGSESKPSLKARGVGETTLLDALKAKELDQANIEFILQAQAQVKSRSTDSMAGISNLVHARGIPERPLSDFDVATGRPLGPQR